MPPKGSLKLRNAAADSSGGSNGAAYVTSILTPYGRAKKTIHYTAKGLRSELDGALTTAQKRRVGMSTHTLFHILHTYI